MDSPEFLGPYRIGEKLGRGGMGTVFSAVHEKSGEPVAVKLIAEHVSDEMRFRQRFDAEVKTLKRLRHPNIVRLIGFGEERGRLFYSMELVIGESLQARIKREKKLPYMFVLDVAIQVCSALKHAHDLGVIHRDLKPANLVITAEGEVKLVDFGIAKIFGHEQTAEGSVMGTADYMAPEQATGQGVTLRADLYALGCVMYAMLCGRPPFRGKSVTEVLESLKTKDPAPLELIDPDLPDDIVQIVHELLAKDPANRPPTALAVTNRLKAMRAGLSRQQTLSGERMDTGIAASGDDHETGRIDLSGEAEQPIDSTGASASSPPDSPTKVRAGKRSQTQHEDFGHPDSTQVKPPAKANPSSGTVHSPGNAPSDQTLPLETDSTGFTEGSRDGLEFDSGDTHFQTVVDSEETGGIFASPANVPGSSFRHFTSIAILILGLLIAVGALVYALQTPSADQLLSGIDQAVEAGKLDEAQKDIERFLKIHPDHPRASELVELRESYRLEATLRRLRLQAKIRTSEPPVYESEFLAAMDLRRTQPREAVERLRQWVNVFVDSEMPSDDPRQELSRLAEFEIERLERDDPAAENERRLDELLRRVESAAALPGEESLERLRAIVELYNEQPWAKKAVEAASRKIQSQ